MRIEERRLVERPCPECGNLERRAFGESISDRGELASYAFGWTSGHEDPLGHMTIGIGVGNPGGGSFHIDVRSGEGSWEMTLVDRPFDRVPQRGPDLTGEQALAHEDLDYVWFVADNVWTKDRRTAWMQHYLAGTPARATSEVAAGAPVLRVERDDDGRFALFHLPVAASDRDEVHLFHSLDRDSTLLDVLDVEPGAGVYRQAAAEFWRSLR
jgi:hypothetical protein